MAIHNNPTPLQLIRRLMVRTPMLRLALATVVGILMAEYLSVPPLVWLGVAVGLCVLLLVVEASIRHTVRKTLFPVLLWLIWMGMGAILPLLHAPADPFPTAARTFSVRFCDTPRPTPKCYKSVAEVTSVDGHPSHGKVLLYIRQDSAAASLRYGDSLSIAARPQSPRNWRSDFDYRRYLRRKGILWQCYVPSDCWQTLAHDSTFSLLGWSKGIQLRMVGRIRQSNLTLRQQGIAEALLLGWRDDVDEATQQQFRDAGITHLLCVSGLHVGIVAWLAGAALFFLGRKRWQRVVKGIVQIGVVWLFVLLTGMAPSTLRAGVMFSLLLIGDMLQRQPNSLNSLCTSMLLLLLIKPMLLFDVGFQLSYAAVAGIVLLNQPLQQLLPHSSKWYLWLPQKAWQLICLSTSAQLATLPLVLYHFHQFPLYFLIANLTVVPFAGVLLASVLLMLLVGGGWATTLLRYELVAVDRLTRWISSLPHAMLTDIYCSLPVALIITALILNLTLLLYTYRKGDATV